MEIIGKQLENPSVFINFNISYNLPSCVKEERKWAITITIEIQSKKLVFSTINGYLFEFPYKKNKNALALIH